MFITIEFNPQEEAWIDTQARLQGLPPAEIVKRLVDEHLPATNGTRAASENVATGINPENQALITLLRSWREEDETDDPEELERRDVETSEFLSNLSANRLALRSPDV